MKTRRSGSARSANGCIANNASTSPKPGAHGHRRRRQAFTIVALANAGDLLGARKFRLDNLLNALPNLAPELADMEHTGLLAREPLKPSGWRVTQEVMLWWLSDELIRALRSESAFGQWLQAEQLEGRWTHGHAKSGRSRQRSWPGRTGLIEKFVAAFGAGVAMSPG